MSCSSNTTISTAPKEVITLIQTKGRCGVCPHYSITILDNKTALFNGFANVTPIGKKNIVLGETHYNDIIERITAATIKDLDTDYRRLIRDFPFQKIIYNQKEIRFLDEGSPEVLKTLATLLKATVPIE